jgi:hypothetical protein
MNIGNLLGLFIVWPWMALIPAITFGVMFFRRRRGVILLTALGWLAYFPYELAMKLRVLCSGECNIRVDLLLFYPLLLGLSVAALIAYRKAGVKSPPAQPLHDP